MPQNGHAAKEHKLHARGRKAWLGKGRPVLQTRGIKHRDIRHAADAERAAVKPEAGRSLAGGLCDALVQGEQPALKHIFLQEAGKRAGRARVACAIQKDAVAAEHRARMGERHVHLFPVHHMGNSQVLRMLPAHLLEHLHIGDEALVFAVRQFDAGHVMIAFKEAVVIRRRADAGAEGVIRIAVNPHIQPLLRRAAVHIGKHLRHLPVSRHAADVGDLQLHARAAADLKEFLDRIVNLKRIAAHMGGNDAVEALDDRSHRAHFMERHAGFVADAHGKAARALGQLAFQRLTHGGKGRLIHGGVFVLCAGEPADGRVPRKQRHVDGLLSVVSRAVGGKIPRGVAAVARHERRHALAQRAQSDVRIDAAVMHVILMGMSVHKARAHDAAGAVDLLFCGEHIARDAHDAPVFHAEVQHAANGVRRVGNKSVFQKQVKHNGIFSFVYSDIWNHSTILVYRCGFLNPHFKKGGSREPPRSVDTARWNQPLFRHSIFNAAQPA